MLSGRYWVLLLASSRPEIPTLKGNRTPNISFRKKNISNCLLKTLFGIWQGITDSNRYCVSQSHVCCLYINPLLFLNYLWRNRRVSNPLPSPWQGDMQPLTPRLPKDNLTLLCARANQTLAERLLDFLVVLHIPSLKGVIVLVFNKCYESEILLCRRFQISAHKQTSQPTLSNIVMVKLAPYVGLEPTTLWLTARHSTDWVNKAKYGGRGEFRNLDLTVNSRLLCLWATHPLN